jgi:hypothetical protein
VETCTEIERGEVAGYWSTRRRAGGEHGDQSGEKMVARRGHPGGGGEAQLGGDGGVACSDTRGQKRKGGGGFRPAVGTRNGRPDRRC